MVTYRNPRNGELFSLYYNALPPESSAVPTLGDVDRASEVVHVDVAKFRSFPVSGVRNARSENR